MKIGFITPRQVDESALVWHAFTRDLFVALGMGSTSHCLVQLSAGCVFGLTGVLIEYTLNVQAAPDNVSINSTRVSFIQRTAHTTPASIKHMCIDHRG